MRPTKVPSGSPIQQPAPSAKFPYLAWVRIRGAGTARSILASDGAIGLRTHWVTDHTEPCGIPFGRPCRFCGEFPEDYGAFVAVYCVPRGPLCALRLTAAAISEVPQLLDGEGYAGFQLTVRRVRPGRRTRLTAELSESRVVELSPQRTVTRDWLYGWLRHYWRLDIIDTARTGHAADPPSAIVPRGRKASSSANDSSSEDLTDGL